MATLNQIERVYKLIFNSVFTVTGNLDYERLGDAVELLCELLVSFDAEDCEQWYIDPYCSCSLGDMIVGLYWHYVEWHGGQYSTSYRVLCRLGQIYKPNMSCEPEEGTSEHDAYSLMNDIAKEYHQ